MESKPLNINEVEVKKSSYIKPILNVIQINSYTQLNGGIGADSGPPNFARS